MRLAPLNHPDYTLFSRWPQVKDAEKAAKHTARYAGRALRNAVGQDLPVTLRFNWDSDRGHHLDLYYYPYRGGLGWVNFERVKSCPNRQFLDAPLILTYSLHCDAPRLYDIQLGKMIAANGPLEAHGHTGSWITLPGSRPVWGGNTHLMPPYERWTYDMIRHPTTCLRLHVHYREAEAWAAQAGRWLLGWRRGDPAPLEALVPEPRPFEVPRRRVIPEFYSPMALEALGAWYELLRSVDASELARISRRVVADRRKGESKRRGRYKMKGDGSVSADAGAGPGRRTRRPDEGPPLQAGGQEPDPVHG
jgi:hypothetical protein